MTTPTLAEALACWKQRRPSVVNDMAKQASAPDLRDAHDAQPAHVAAVPQECPRQVPDSATSRGVPTPTTPDRGHHVAAVRAVKTKGKNDSSLV